jgi:serine/threonine protein phosphatase PrpC
MPLEQATYPTKSARGAGEVPVTALFDFVQLTLGQAVPAAVGCVFMRAGGQLILTSDGIHDSVSSETIEALAREHHPAHQALAEALVAAVEPDADRQRDDATAVVIS